MAQNSTQRAWNTSVATCPPAESAVDLQTLRQVVRVPPHPYPIVWRLGARCLRRQLRYHTFPAHSFNLKFNLCKRTLGYKILVYSEKTVLRLCFLLVNPGVLHEETFSCSVGTHESCTLSDAGSSDNALKTPFSPCHESSTSVNRTLRDIEKEA